MSLLLFDIDGTLLLSGGAGVRAMSRAFEAMFGVADAFVGIAVAGRTDTFLLSRALQRASLPDTPEQHRRFRDIYHAVLAEEIHQPGSGRRGALPGVSRLLSALRERPEFHLALLTGNYEAAARIKLTHFALDAFFEWGIYGDASEDRDELARLAMTLARARAVPAPACERAAVIGDTPHDIACARAAGARAIAVATGSHTVAELRAAGADVVLRDLSDTDAVLSVVE